MSLIVVAVVFVVVGGGLALPLGPNAPVPPQHVRNKNPNAAKRTFSRPCIATLQQHGAVLPLEGNAQSRGAALQAEMAGLISTGGKGTPLAGVTGQSDGRES